MVAGIIGAMEPEVAQLKKLLSNASEHQHGGFTFTQGELDSTPVVIVQSGIGKVAAALATAALIAQYKPSYIVNTGSAGGFDASLNIGDVVIGNEVRYHDVDVTAFGYEIGQLPANPAAFSADERLIKAAETAIASMKSIQTTVGLITTGDTFMTAEADIAKARANFPTMAAVEMEGAAIAQTCHFYQTPCVVIRSLSDIAGKESPSSFDAYLETASINSSKMVRLMINQLAQQTWV